MARKSCARFPLTFRSIIERNIKFSLHVIGEVLHKYVSFLVYFDLEVEE